MQASEIEHERPQYPHLVKWMNEMDGRFGNVPQRVSSRVGTSSPLTGHTHPGP